MQLAWHGAASVTLRANGLNILVDPLFSPPEAYGDWYTPNPHRPDLDEFLERFAPDYVFITHGHFDHFDVETTRLLADRTDCRFAGSSEVCSALKRLVGVDPDRLLPVTAGESAALGTLVLEPVQGVHWLTMEEGDAAAKKLADRPDRHGVMPCGGPMLGFFLRTGKETLYLSGDTEPEGVPNRSADAAVLNIVGSMYHPVTKERRFSALCPETAGEALRRIRPRTAVLIHHDFEAIFLEGKLDLTPIYEEARALPNPPELVVPPYHEWIDL